MLHGPHELAGEFPAKAARMQALKQSGAHFAKLADEYHEVNRAEINVEPADAQAEGETLRKRAALRDEIWGILSKA